MMLRPSSAFLRTTNILIITPIKNVWYSNDGTYNEPILAIIAPQSVECKLEAGSWGVAYEP
jgi:hypothetical protein